MSRRAATRIADFRRASEAVAEFEKDGKPVAAVEVKPDGSIFVRFGKPLAGDTQADDDLSSVIEAIKSNGQARRAN